MTAVSAPAVVAIDGPAASGKGTVAKGVAQALGFHYLDSGALYRLVALKALRQAIPVDDETALATAAGELDASFEGDAVSLGGDDVAEAIRDEAVGVAASRVAVYPRVRSALLHWQRSFRRAPGLVAEGRDMGTEVFPDAVLKAYITASAEERARRRYNQLIMKGNSVTIDGLLRDIQERDARDSNRAEAPLKVAADAVVLDTTDLTIDAAIAFVVRQYRALAAAERK